MIHIRGIDKRAAARLPAAFPADVHHRIIIWIGAAEENAVLLRPEDGVIADLHAADEIFARRNQNFAAAGNSASIESLLEGDGVLVRAITERAKVANIEQRK